MSSRRLIGTSLGLSLMALPLLLHGCSADQLVRFGLLRDALPSPSVDCPSLDDLAEGDAFPPGCEALLEAEQQSRLEADAAAASASTPTPAPTPGPAGGGLSGKVEFVTGPSPAATTPPPFPKIETPTPEPAPSAIQGSLGE
ncbi:MAG: hypothetical protein FJY99_01280 [Candidatus Sericytochromatia bacterium]|nr:hypothetical protein [Candidatus Tanganyikabacteria bacterium]